MNLSNGTIAIRDKVEDLKAQLAKRNDTITKLLPSHFMSTARFTQIVTTVAAKNPYLLECKPGSLIGSVLTCAAIGLSPEPVLGQAFFVPFKKTAQMIVGYKGFGTLGWRSGIVSELSMEVVREGDEFDFGLGTKRFIHHVPKRKNHEAPLEWAYATFSTASGGNNFKVLERDEIEAIKAKSPSLRSPVPGPWITHFDSMAMKSAFRRLAKLMPLSNDERSHNLARAIDLDERAELGLNQHTEELLGDETDVADDRDENDNHTADTRSDPKPE